MTEVGIVVGSGFVDRQWKLSIITREGESWVSLKDDIFFNIPSVCSADLATRCGIDPVPENPTQLNARVEVLKRIRTVEREVENAVMGISKKLLPVYDSVRAKDPTEWAEVTVTEIAKIFNKNPTAVQIYAAHKLLINHPTRFVAANAYTANQIFRVRPANDVEDLLQVQEWVREKDPVIEEFVVKALKVMETQRELMESTRTDEPSVQKAEHSWSTTDKTIIRLLMASLRHARSIQADPYTVPLGFILRRFHGWRTVEYVDHEVQRLLVGIGVLTPWQDLIAIDASHKLDLEARPAVLQKREQGILRALENPKNPNPIHPEDFYATDPMASVRHDWGDMPIYVVDSVGAEELDDGISIERIHSEPGSFWVHVHVADPASLIPPTHNLAQKAAQQSESWYMIPKSFPLFPKSLVHHPTHGLSLGVRSKNGLPDRVMTFSVKVDPRGNMVDYAVRASLIRNVKVISYDAVDAAMGQPPTRLEYPFGGAPPRLKQAPLTPEALEDMKLLNEVAMKQRQRRLAMNWFTFDRTTGHVERTSDFPPTLSSGTIVAQLNAPHFHKGFPGLTYRVERFSDSVEYGARSIIAEMMKLASRAASRFFSDRNVAAPYRTSRPLIPVSEEAIDILLSKRSEIGYIPEEEALPHIIYSPPAQYQITPGMHYGLATPEGEGYVRVTSPLRRYGDLVAHWQIQSVLLNEKEGKVTRNGVKAIFDAEWMEDFVGSLMLKDQHLKGTQRRHNRYWALLYIKRWQEMFSDGKNQHLWPRDEQGNPIPDPLEGLEGYLVANPLSNKLKNEMQLVVQIPRLGLKEVVENVPMGVLDELTEVGMTVPVNVKYIRLGIKPIMYLEYNWGKAKGEVESRMEL